MTGHRLRAVDAARAVALIGMMGTHLLAEYGDDGRLTPWFWFFAGRASALFAVLAGVGLALLTGGEQPRLRPFPAVAARVVVRAALIALIGFTLVALDPPIAVILVNYALLFVLALPVLGWPARRLIGLAAVWVVVVPLLSHGWRASVEPGPGAQLAFGDLAHPASLLTRVGLTGYYPVLTWVAYLLVGLAVGRMPLRRPRTGWDLAGVGAMLVGLSWLASWSLLALGGWDALRAAGPRDVVWEVLGPAQLQLRGLYGTTPTTSWWWQAVSSPHSGTPFDLVSTIGSALLVIGLCLVLCRAPRGALGRGVVTALASTGSMTLTLYTAHVVVADAQYDAQPDLQHRGLVLGMHVAVAVLVAVLWRSRFPRGPLEQVVHTVSTAAARPFGATRQGEPVRPAAAP